ncbi:hypothetical protein Bca101_098602 [Brassica carinata]
MVSASERPQFISNNGGNRSFSNAPLIDNSDPNQIIVPEFQSQFPKEELEEFLCLLSFLVSIAYIDPGNFETDLQSGAQYKYELLWIILVASCAALVIQSLAANLGVVTGKHLAEHYRAEYSKVPNFLLWVVAEIAVVACDIPEGTNFLYSSLHFSSRISLTLMLLALQQYGLEFLIAFLVFTIAICFFVELHYSKPDPREVLHGLFVPQLKGNGATGLAISLLGAMAQSLPPLCLSSLKKDPTFSYCPEDRAKCEDLDLNKASFLLRNAVGKWSSKLFARALLASGQSSTITGTYAGQYVMQGFLDLRLEPWLRNFLTRCLAIIPSLVVAIIGGSAGAGKLIIIASMILSFELPFALVPLLKFTSCKIKMGSYVNQMAVSALTWVIGGLIMGINIYYLVSSFIKLLVHSHMKLGLVVFCGILGFSGIAIYLASIAYLVFRRNRKAIPLLASTNSQTVETLPRQDIVDMQLHGKLSTSDVD